MTITQEIGKRIRKLRINNDHTQETMAQALELTPGAYAKIERGETDPSVTRLFEIAQILKVDIVVLLKDEVSRNVARKAGSAISRDEFDTLMATVSGIEKSLSNIQPEPAKSKKAVPRKAKK
jgi:transcriptional regulator with XRE-family HTH domain